MKIYQAFLSYFVDKDNTDNQVKEELTHKTGYRNIIVEPCIYRKTEDLNKAKKEEFERGEVVETKEGQILCASENPKSAKKKLVDFIHKTNKKPRGFEYGK